MVLTTSGGKYCLNRHNALELLLPGGIEGDEDNLRDLLSGITRETFNNVFAASASGNSSDSTTHLVKAPSMRRFAQLTAGLDHQLLTETQDSLSGGMAELFKLSGPKGDYQYGPKRPGASAKMKSGPRKTSWLRSTGYRILSPLWRAPIESASRPAASIECRTRSLEGASFHCLNIAVSARPILTCVRTNAKRGLRLTRSGIHLDSPLLRLSSEIRDALRERSQLVAFGKQKPELQHEREDARRDFAAAVSRLEPEWTGERIESLPLLPPMALAEIDAMEGTLRRTEIEVAEARAAERKAVEDHKTAGKKKARSRTAADL